MISAFFFLSTELLGYSKGIGNWKLVFPQHPSFSAFKVGRHISSWIELHNRGVQTIRIGYLSWDMCYFILMSMTRADVLRWAKALVCWFFSVHSSSISKHYMTGNKQGCRSSGLNKCTVPTLAIPQASQDKKKTSYKFLKRCSRCLEGVVYHLHGNSFLLTTMVQRAPSKVCVC